MKTVKCHICGATLSVCDDPVHLPDDPFGPLITPKLQGPFICPVCRVDTKKLKAARELMETYLVEPVRTRPVRKDVVPRSYAIKTRSV